MDKKLGKLGQYLILLTLKSRHVICSGSLLLVACSPPDVPPAGGSGSVETPTVMFDLDISPTLSNLGASENLVMRLGDAWTETSLLAVDKNRGGRRKVGLSWSAPEAVESAVATVCQPAVMGGARLVRFGDEPVQTEKIKLTKSVFLESDNVVNLDISKLRNGDSILDIGAVSDRLSLCVVALKFPEENQSDDISRYFALDGDSIVLIRANLFRDYLRRQKSRYSEKDLQIQIDGFDLMDEQAWYMRLDAGLSY